MSSVAHLAFASQSRSGGGRPCGRRRFARAWATRRSPRRWRWWRGASGLCCCGARREAWPVAAGPDQAGHPARLGRAGRLAGRPGRSAAGAGGGPGRGRRGTRRGSTWPWAARPTWSRPSSRLRRPSRRLGRWLPTPRRSRPRCRGGRSPHGPGSMGCCWRSRSRRRGSRGSGGSCGLAAPRRPAWWRRSRRWPRGSAWQGPRRSGGCPAPSLRCSGRPAGGPS